MTKLIVRPIDPKAPGSYRERKQLMQVARLLNRVRTEDATNLEATVDAYEAVEALLLPRLATDDETTVEAALDLLSAEQFDELLGKVTGVVDAVPPVSASDSSSQPEATETAPTG